MNGPILLDNTVLTNFAVVGRSDLPLRLWSGGACTTPAVLDEFQAGVAGGALPEGGWASLPIVRLEAEASALTPVGREPAALTVRGAPFGAGRGFVVRVVQAAKLRDNFAIR